MVRKTRESSKIAKKKTVLRKPKKNKKRSTLVADVTKRPTVSMRSSSNKSALSTLSTSTSGSGSRGVRSSARGVG